MLCHLEGNKPFMEENGEVDVNVDEEEPRPDSDQELPEPKPGVTAPLDDLTEDEKKMGPTGVLPGAGPDQAKRVAERKREFEREGRHWGWEDEDRE